VKGKYPTNEKTDKSVYGYVGKLTQMHPEMVLAIPYFSGASSEIPYCVAYMPWSCVRPHSRGFRCQPAMYRANAPCPRREYRRFFDKDGIDALVDDLWSQQTVG
jgi:hypothetical protein